MRPKILGRIFCAFLALRLKLTIFDHKIKNRKCKFHKKRSHRQFFLVEAKKNIVFLIFFIDFMPDLSYNRGRMDWVVPIRRKNSEVNGNAERCTCGAGNPTELRQHCQDLCRDRLPPPSDPPPGL